MGTHAATCDCVVLVCVFLVLMCLDSLFKYLSPLLEPPSLNGMSASLSLNKQEDQMTHFPPMTVSWDLVVNVCYPLTVSLVFP